MQTTTNFRFSYLSSVDSNYLQQIKLNENFALNDLMLNARLYSLTPFVTPPVSAINGVFYLVGKNALEAFAGQDAKIASFTQNGWRFTELSDGMIFFLLENSQFYYSVNGGFERLLSQSMYSSGGNTFIQVVPQSAVTGSLGGASSEVINKITSDITTLQATTAKIESDKGLYVLKTDYLIDKALFTQNLQDTQILLSNVDINTKDIVGCKKSIQTLSDANSVNVASINGLNTAVANNTSNISGLSTTLDLNIKDITECKASIKTVSDNLNTSSANLQTSLTQNTNDIKSLATKTDANTTGITNCQTSIQTLSDANSVNVASINGLNTAVANNTSNISGLSLAIDAIKNTAKNTIISYAKFTTGDFKASMVQTDHDGFLLCDGRAVSRATYSDLFTLTGSSFGNGDGVATFNLPDFRGRVFGALGQGAGLTLRTLGMSLGEEKHLLTTAETPVRSHSHTQNVRVALGTAPTIGVSARGKLETLIGSEQVPSSVSFEQDKARTTTDSASFTNVNAHNVMQPTLFAGNYFIFSGVSL